MNELTHFDAAGASRMVDVGDKPISVRAARASCRISMRAETLRRILDRAMTKGDVLEVARLAGIQAAKETSRLIPLCHLVPLDSVSITLAPLDATTLAIESEARATARTGVEMEALVAAGIAALTVYDMCKAIDRGMVIEQVRLEEKSGGRSGHFQRGQSGID